MEPPSREPNTLEVPLNIAALEYPDGFRRPALRLHTTHALAGEVAPTKEVCKDETNLYS